MNNKAKKLVRLIIDRQYRAKVFMQRLHSSRVQQTTQLTCMNRYPEEFNACREYFKDRDPAQIRILSFGCCTGEEVVTLREYFPEATIVGAELNKDSLRTCKKRKLDNKIHFIKSTPKLIEKNGPYDAVFAMAVLERTPHYIKDNHIKDISNIYPYEKYEKQVIELDGHLKEDGLFICAYTHYYLLDTPLREKYEVYGNTGFIGILFNRESKIKIEDGFINDIFKKRVKG